MGAGIHEVEVGVWFKSDAEFHILKKLKVGAPFKLDEEFRVWIFRKLVSDLNLSQTSAFL